MSFILKSGDVIPTADMVNWSQGMARPSVISDSPVTVYLSSEFGGASCKRVDLANDGQHSITIARQGGGSFAVIGGPDSPTITLAPQEQVTLSKNSGFDAVPVAQKEGTGVYTAATLPDPETLVPGVPVVVDGIPAVNNGVAMRGLAVNETALRNVHGRITNAYLTVATFESPDGRTNCVAMQMEARFNRFRILLANSKTTSAATFGPACATVAPQVTSDVEARNNSATPTPITWSGAATVTIPAASVAGVPNYVWSDWINLSSVDPTDGSGRPWLIVRVFTPYDATFHTNNANDSDLWRTTVNGGRWVMGAYTDFTGANYANFNGSFAAGNQQTPVIGMQGAYSGSVFNVAGFGDSLMNGYGSGVTQTGKTMLWDAKEIVTRTFNIPVSIMNYGWTGQASAQFYARLLAEIDNLNASAIIYEAYSTNDGSPTDALILAAKGRVSEVVRVCRSKGIIPIIWTPRVNNTWTTAQKQLIKDYYDALKSTVGLVLFDEYSAVVDSATLGINTSYTVDGVHLNQAGVDVATPELVKALKQALYGSQLIALP